MGPKMCISIMFWEAWSVNVAPLFLLTRPPLRVDARDYGSGWRTMVSAPHERYSQPLVLAILEASTLLLAPILLMASER